MNKLPFTRGPWRSWAPRQQNGGILITDASGVVAVARVIAVQNDDVESHQKAASDQLALANAALIEAAPALYEIARFALAKFCDPHACDTDPASSALKQMAEAVLARIEGK